MLYTYLLFEYTRAQLQCTTITTGINLYLRISSRKNLKRCKDFTVHAGESAESYLLAGFPASQSLPRAIVHGGKTTADSATTVSSLQISSPVTPMMKVQEEETSVRGGRGDRESSEAHEDPAELHARTTG